MAKKRQISKGVRSGAKVKTLLDMGFTLTRGTTPTAETSPSDGFNANDQSSGPEDQGIGVSTRSLLQNSSPNDAHKMSSGNNGASNCVKPRRPGRPKLSSEEKEKIMKKRIAKQSARRREREQAMTPEERKIYFRNIHATRRKPTAEQLENRRQYQKLYREKMKPERNAKRRAKHQAMTPEERKAYNKKVGESKRKPTEETRAKENEYRRKRYKEFYDREGERNTRERKKAKAREKYHAMKPEERKTFYKVWQKKNPEKFREYRRKYYRNMPPDKKEKKIIMDSARSRRPATCTYCRKTVSQCQLNNHVEMHRRSAALHAPLTPDIRSGIELMSRGGADSEGGKRVRQYRITGTRAKEVISWTNNGKDLNKLACNYSHPSGGINVPKTPAMIDGTNFEIDAINAYQNILGIPDANMQKNVGLLVHPRFSYLGATPDARFTSNNGQKGSLEVKYIVAGIATAPYLLKGKSRIWTAGKRGDYLTPVPGGSRGIRQLNRNHKYFTQVVMQIMCGEMDFGDFVVYSKNKQNPNELDLWRETISREEAEKEWTKMEPILTEFFNNHLGPPSLLMSVATRTMTASTLP